MLPILAEEINIANVIGIGAGGGLLVAALWSVRELLAIRKKWRDDNLELHDRKTSLDSKVIDERYRLLDCRKDEYITNLEKQLEEERARRHEDKREMDEAIIKADTMFQRIQAQTGELQKQLLDETIKRVTAETKLTVSKKNGDGK